MDGRRDYYEIMGVPRDADAEAIKRAFRELALRYHPDRSQEPDAEERFKEIAEAYAVLGDPQKRAQYDAHGFAGVSGVRPEDAFAGVDLDDLFGGLGFDFGGPSGGGLFERFFGARRRGPPRGSNIEVQVEIPLEMVATGGERRVSVGHPRNCATCAGSGAKPGTTPRPCETCHGTGQQTQTRQEGSVRMQAVRVCPRCGGRGRFIDEACAACGGGGRVADEETLSVRIPVGVREGMTLRVPGKGMPAPEGGGAPGDLYVVVRVRPDPRFTRRGAHLWREEELAVADAVLGIRLTVPTLDGRAHLEVPPGTQPDTVLRLQGKGLPEFGSGARGDLYVALRVRVPAAVSPEERELWERLRGLAGDHSRS
jgi:molecular chaperone DnaJ